MDPDARSPADDTVVAAIRNWLERGVIGLSLCPFAKAPHVKGQIRYVVSHAETPEAVRQDLSRELRRLSDADPEAIETTLLITPRAFAHFLEYNDFLAVADGVVEELGLTGVLQIASFHPDYQFADVEPTDPANCSNRSPYPILHLLREASVDRAVEAFPEAEAIFEKNVAKLRAIGHAGWERVLAGEDSAPRTDGALQLSPALLGVLAELGFRELTKIQEESIPLLLAGLDLVGQSQTGSGKTAAFALPLLQRLTLDARELQALVLCPTRELCAQVAREVRKLGRACPGLSVVPLAGGEPVRDQSSALERGAHVAVGTPGRVLDHLRRRTLRVHRVATIVLDEADRMLDMGFQPDIEKVLKALPTQRQTVLFSATFPDSIRELSQRYQQNPRWVRVDEAEQERPAIRELVVRCQAGEKLRALRSVLETHPHEAAIVFANLKTSVAEVEQALRAAGISVASLHGDLEQRDRDRVMAKFRNGSTRVLVATDVAARGIDLETLPLVVNFDLPNQAEVYVHRIGRTGRAGKSGVAIALCVPGDEPKLEAIEAFTGHALTPLQRDARKSERSLAKDAGGRAPRAGGDAKMETLRISGGRKDKLRPGDILGALTGEAGRLAGEDIGKIEIHDRFTFVAVTKAVTQQALKSLSEGKIKGRRFRVARVE